MTTATPTAAATAASETGAAVTRAGDRRSKRLMTWLFLAPTLIGLGIFLVIPIIGSLVLSFFSWDVLTAPKFIGFRNFAAIGSDPTVRRSFLNTFAFVIIVVAVQLALSLFLAVLVQTRMPGWLRTFFRSAFFFPLILSAASVSLVMSYLFNADFGLINKMLTWLHLPAVGWLTTGAGAAVVVVIVYVWQNFGFTFLLFLGGLSSIPQDVYEACAIDGAHGWSRFRHITVPLLSPTTLVASVMAAIAALQIFDQPWVLTRGGPGDSTRTAVMVIYQSAFQELDFGRAFAIGIILTLCILAVTGLQFLLSRRFVHYQ